MGKRIRDYVKYTFSELETYTNSPSSCVNKINATSRLIFPPYGLGNFKKSLQKIIADKKIGAFDPHLKGIILDMRNIKVLSDLAPLLFNHPGLHINIQADCYVFQPQVGATIKGLVKHISDRQIGVIIYRVFSVSIRLNGSVPKRVKLNCEIEFRIKQFDLENDMPFIEGELVGDVEKDESASLVERATNSSRIKKSVKFEPKTENGSSGYNSDGLPFKTHTTLIKKELKTNYDSDASSYLDPSQIPSTRKSASSPDMFSDPNVSDEDNDTYTKLQRTPKKIKEEIIKAVEQENLVIEAPRKKHKKGNDSISSTQVSYLEPGQNIKAEKLSQSGYLSRSEVAQVNTVFPLQTPKRKTKGNTPMKEETDETPRRVKIESENLHRAQDEENLAIEEDTQNLLSPTSETRTKKRKRVASDDDDNVQSVAVGKTNKRQRDSQLKEIITEIVLKSDFEMTTSVTKHKKKKKKRSNEASFEEVNENVELNSELVNPNEVIAVDSLPRKKDQKKKKSKDKDEIEDRSGSLSSSLSNILAKIKAEKGI